MKLIVSLLILFNLSFASSTPTAFKYLLNDNVTLLDFGLYKLELEISKRIDGYSKMFKEMKIYNSDVDVNYDINHNKININIVYFFDTSTTSVNNLIPNAKILCKTTITNIRYIYTTFGITDFFKHQGNFARTDKPDDFDKQIKDNTYINVSMINKPFLECKAKLYGTQIFYSK